MSEKIEKAKLNFAEARINFEKNNVNAQPMSVTYRSFTAIGGQAEELGKEYLYKLNEKYGDELLPRLEECRKLIEITMLALVECPIDISVAWRTAIAVSAGEIESRFFKPVELDELADFLDIVVLFYLVSASIAAAAAKIQASIEFVFEAQESRRLAELTNEDISKEEFLSQMASNSARKRHAQDPKQIERIFVFECWCSWRKKPETYKSKAAFARDMLSKCENLESQKVIEDWCRLWEKEIK